MVAAEQTVMAIAARDRPDEAEELIVGLSAVLNQSLSFAFSSNHEEPELSAYRELVTLTGFTCPHGGRTQFWNANSERPLLDLAPDFTIKVPAPDYPRGETVLYGKIERVGGEELARLLTSQRS